MLFNLCVDQAYTVYILPTYPLNKTIKIIYQSNSIDAVITMPYALGRWNHTRWVVKDYLQQFKINFNSIFAVVVKLMAF